MLVQPEGLICVQGCPASKQPKKEMLYVQNKNGAGFPQAWSSFLQLFCPRSPGYVRLRFDMGGLEIPVDFS